MLWKVQTVSCMMGDMIQSNECWQTCTLVICNYLVIISQSVFIFLDIVQIFSTIFEKYQAISNKVSEIFCLAVTLRLFCSTKNFPQYF